MKTNKLLIQAALLAAMAVFGVGCGQSNSSEPYLPPGAVDGSGVVPTTPTGERGGNFAAGATAALVGYTIQDLSDYVATHPVNSPKDLAISVQLSEIEPGKNKYAGTVYISYHDNGKYYTQPFQALNAVIPKNESSSFWSGGMTYSLHGGKNYAEYNEWFTFNNKAVFHGYFQDAYGAIMLVVNDSLNLGDANGASFVNGEIWFKNYSVSMAPPNPQGLPCWFIEAGPYDCRGFEAGGSTSALYPSMGWKRLGKFIGLDKRKAFGQ